MASTVIYLNEDRVLVWLGASYTDATGTVQYLNSATITYAIKTVGGATVAGGTGTLDYVSGTNGNYRGVVESTVTADTVLSEGTQYNVWITLSQAPYDGFRKLVCRAEYRGST